MSKIETNLLINTAIVSLIIFIIDTITIYFFKIPVFFIFIKKLNDKNVLNSLSVIIILIMGFVVNQFISLSFSSNEYLSKHFVYNKNLLPLYIKYFKEHLIVSFISLFITIVSMIIQMNIICYVLFSCIFTTGFLSFRFFWVIITLFKIQQDYVEDEVLCKAVSSYLYTRCDSIEHLTKDLNSILNIEIITDNQVSSYRGVHFYRHTDKSYSEDSLVIFITNLWEYLDDNQKQNLLNVMKRMKIPN